MARVFGPRAGGYLFIAVGVGLYLLLDPPIPDGVLGGLLGVIALVAIMQRRATSDASGVEDADEQVQPGGFKEPFEFSYTVSSGRHENLDAISKRLTSDAHLRLVDRADLGEMSTATLRGGSQLWTRLRGGYWVDTRYLPVRVELRKRTTDGESTPLELHVVDALGFTLRDEALRRRYLQRAADIKEVIDRAAK